MRRTRCNDYFRRMTKILVLGANGQLGRALQRIPDLKHAEFFDRRAVDLSRLDDLTRTLESKSFDVLVNAAAYTAVDKAEAESELAFIVNGDAPAKLAEICEKKGAAMIHVSTDYVFGDTRPEPLAETHPTEPYNVYGRSKLRGEELVRKHCPRHLIIRTAWLYGPVDHNFVRTMLRLGAERDELKVVYDQVGAPTNVRDLAEVVAKLALSFPKEESLWGTYHYANAGVCSWYDVAHAIFELSGMRVNLKPVRSIEFPTPAKRPPYSVLDTDKIVRNFAVKIRHWRTALRDCLDEIKSGEND